MAEDEVSMLAANVAVGVVVRGAWLLVAVGLVACSPASSVKGTIYKPVQVHLLPQMMVQPW